MQRCPSFRFGARFLLVLASVVGFSDGTLLPTMPGAGAIYAQEEGAKGDAAEAPKAPPKEEAAPRRQSVLQFTYSALGWYYTVAFLGLSFSLVALLIMNILSARRDSICPQQLVEIFEQHLNERKFQEAYEIAKADESFLGQILAAGLARLSFGYDKAVAAMQEVGEEENMKLEHRLSYMALIGTISPMVGLLGTVDGMVRSFSVIANNPSTPKPSELAHGISTALITTLAGLIIAIPALAAFNILKNRVARLILEVGIVSEGLMSRFETSNVVKK